jgi:hypothetical protein
VLLGYVTIASSGSKDYLVLTLCSTSCRLRATSVNIHSSSVYHYMFRPNWPSSGVRVVVMKESAALLPCCSASFLCKCLILFYVIWVIVLLPCICLIYL